MESNASGFHSGLFSRHHGRAIIQGTQDITGWWQEGVCQTMPIHMFLFLPSGREVRERLRLLYLRYYNMAGIYNMSLYENCSI